MKKINIGDVVEVNYPFQPTWNGLQFRVKETNERASYFNGTVIKTTPKQAVDYPIGSIFTWSWSEGLVIVEPKKEQPTSNQVYIDHIFERLVQNATKQELLNLAAKLEGFVTGMVVHARPWPEETLTKHNAV